VCVTVTVVTDRETDIGPYTKLRYGVEPRSAKTSLHCTYTVDLYALAVVIHHVALYPVLDTAASLALSAFYDPYRSPVVPSG